MKRAFVPLVAVAVVALAVGAWLLLREPTPAADDAKPVPAEPTRSVADLAAGVERLRQQRGGFPAEQALLAARTEEERAAAQKLLEMQRETPRSAASEARDRLVSLEQELSAAKDDDQKQRLEREKRMVEEIIAKLEAM
jgi:hypothetical protein